MELSKLRDVLDFRQAHNKLVNAKKWLRLSGLVAITALIGAIVVLFYTLKSYRDYQTRLHICESRPSLYADCSGSYRDAYQESNNLLKGFYILAGAAGVTFILAYVAKNSLESQLRNIETNSRKH